MDEHSVFDADEVERALQSLLARYPDAGVAAIRPNGFFVPLPRSVILGKHTVLQARAATDLVNADQRTRVARTWDAVRASGMSRIAVHLLNGNSATFHFLDVRERHGVLMLVLAADGALDPIGGMREPVDTVPRVCTLRRDDSAVIINVDDAATKMLGWAREEMVGRRSLEFVHPEDHARVIDNWMAALAAPELSHRLRGRYRRRNGTWLWLEVTNDILTTPGEEGHVVSEMIDISAEMAAHEELRAREQLLHRLTEALPTGVVQIDQAGRIVYKNDKVDQLVGHPEAITLDEQLASTQPEDRDMLARAVSAVLMEGMDQDIEVRLQAAGHRRHRVCLVVMRSLTSDLGEVSGAIVCVSDVTESTVLRNELEALVALADSAMYDSKREGVGRPVLLMAPLETPPLTVVPERSEDCEDPASPDHDVADAPEEASIAPQ